MTSFSTHSLETCLFGLKRVSKFKGPGKIVLLSERPTYSRSDLNGVFLLEKG